MSSKQDTRIDPYKEPVARDVLPMLDSHETYAGMLADAFAAPHPPDALLPSQPQLSSIGLVDGKWSFGGTSYINMCYNEKWQTDEFIKGFLERVAEVLMDNMGLS
ncbi:hypothetical protein GE09DRAFT_1224802 [Coniochaeta sp. 2T2.1]|nr:hypothetical protein GE09DRAFT_1224802 [Coniochaeta sp. 2T2.1]